MPTKVLMVCLGNICRSPLAEGLLKSKVDANNIYVDSAGTAGYHVGSLPDSRSIEIARKHNIDITDQRSRKFKVDDFKYFDYIYAMDLSNFNDILSLAPNESDGKKVKLLLQEINRNINEVPDPYYGGEQGFAQVFELIDQGCEIIVESLIKQEKSGNES